MTAYQRIQGAVETCFIGNEVHVLFGIQIVIDFVLWIRRGREQN